MFCLACVPAIAGGAVVFGYGVLGVCLWGVLGALAGDRLCRAVVNHSPRRHVAQLVSVGLLLSMTLPPTVGWWVPFVGGVAGVAIGQWTLGGLGNYVWHPALVGRVAAQVLFPDAVAPASWPFLGNGRLLTGLLDAASPGVGYRGFLLSRPPPGFDAWSLPRPVDSLVQHCRPAGEGAGAGVSLLETFRDHLPPWGDTVWGVVGGGIGETCAVALIAGGLLLLYRRCLRWQLPAGALVTVALLAAVWPVRVDGGAGPVVWFPIVVVRDGFAVGGATVLFHLTGGGLLLACLLVAPDPVSTPLTARGHLLFGIGLGVLTFVARVSGLTPGSTYWAVLGMNTLVPLIDRITRRRVYGT